MLCIFVKFLLRFCSFLCCIILSVALFICAVQQAYNPDSAWWNFCVAGNYVSQFYSFAIKAIRDVQQKLQTEFNHDVQEVEIAVKKLLEGAKDASSSGEFI